MNTEKPTSPPKVGAVELQEIIDFGNEWAKNLTKREFLACEFMKQLIHINEESDEPGSIDSVAMDALRYTDALLKAIVNHSTTLVLVLLFLISGTGAIAQTWPKNDTLIFHDNVFLKRYTAKNKFVTSTNERLIVLEVDANTEYTITKIQYDTVYTLSETIEPTSTRFTVVNMATAINSTKPDITDKSFSYVVDASKAASGSATFIGAMIELYSERFAGDGTAGNPKHSVLQVYIDNVLSGTFNQGTPEVAAGVSVYRTDIKRGAPTFRKKVPAGPHTVSVRSTTGQHIIDAFKVYTYTLQPRPVQ